MLIRLFLLFADARDRPPKGVTMTGSADDRTDLPATSPNSLPHLPRVAHHQHNHNQIWCEFLLSSNADRVVRAVANNRGTHRVATNDNVENSNSSPTSASVLRHER